MNRTRLATATFALLLVMRSADTWADVTIVRDNTGLPHVYGETNYEVFFGFGYIMAADRLFQMEMRKRQALGTVAEVLGAGDKRWPDKYLSKDREARISLDPDALRHEFDALSIADKEIITGFTAGINKSVREMLQNPDGQLSRQFKDYGFLPRLWTAHETLAVAADVLGAYSSFDTQLINLELYEFLRGKFPQQCDDIFDQFLWLSDPRAPTTKLDHQRADLTSDPALPRGCGKDGQTPNNLKLSTTTRETTGLDYLVAPQHEPVRASMSWLVGGERAQDFQSIFINGPQPGWHSPSYYYPIGLHGGDFNTVGFAAEGSFVLQIGVNDRFSWGLTAGLSSQADQYQMTVGDDGRCYMHDGKCKPFAARLELINIKGGEPHAATIRSTVHGPVVASDPKRGIVYARRIAWDGTAAAGVMNWVRSTRSQSFESWLDRTREVGFNYNLFYADRDGNVGFSHTGRFPTRTSSHDHRLPAAGGGGFDWTGFMPADQNPYLLTKKEIVNFNNKPQRNWLNSGLYWEQWAEANQVDILIEALDKKQRLTWDDMWAINRVISYTDVSAGYFMPFLMEAATAIAPDSEEAQALDILRDWNRLRTDDDKDGYFDHPGQTLFDAWLPIMVRNTLAPTLKGYRGAGIWLNAGYQTSDPRLEEHPSAGTLVLYHALLNSKGRSGVKHHYDFFGGVPAQTVVIKSLQEAITALKGKFQGPMSQWRSKALPQVFFTSNANRIPITNLDAGFRLPLFANRGALNLQVAYGADGTAVAGYVNPPGQVGHMAPGGKPLDNALSGHHLAAYRDFGLFPLFLTRDSVFANRGPGDVLRFKAEDIGKGKL